MSKKSTATLIKALKHWTDDCPGRVETTRFETPRPMTTVHCVDCGAHQAYDGDGQPVPPPTVPGPFNIDPKPGLYDGITLEHAE